MRIIKWFLIVATLGLSWSCTKIPANNLYTPVSGDATANATLAELQEGRTLYINNCGKCHSLYSPDDFSVSTWKAIIPVMAPNTTLDGSQVILVTKYVTRGNQ